MIKLNGKFTSFFIVQIISVLKKGIDNMRKQIYYSLSLVFFWVKGFIEVDDKMIKVERANTLFGFIPAGSDKQKFPLGNISAVRLSTSYKVKPILFGGVLMFSALGLLESNILGAILLFIIGSGILGSGLRTTLILERSGQDYYIDGIFYEKQKFLMMEDAITEAIYKREENRDLSNFMERIN